MTPHAADGGIELFAAEIAKRPAQPDAVRHEAKTSGVHVKGH